MALHRWPAQQPGRGVIKLTDRPRHHEVLVQTDRHAEVLARTTAFCHVDHPLAPIEHEQPKDNRNDVVRDDDQAPLSAAGAGSGEPRAVRRLTIHPGGAHDDGRLRRATPVLGVDCRRSIWSLSPGAP